MQQYLYEAKDSSGLIIKAQVEAANVSDAAKLLTSKNLFPLRIEEKKKGALGSLSLESLNRITVKDRVLFTRQLATLVKAGLPLAKALQVLQGQITNPKMLKLVKTISASVEGGTPLSQSLIQNSTIFSPVYISMVEAGEASGSLDETLMRLAAQEEKQAAINAKIKGAFTYPVVVLFVLLAVMIMMITLVLPQVAKMYSDLKHPLPPLTQLLMQFSTLFTKFWYIFIIAFVAAGYALRVWSKTPAGVSLIDTFKLKVPAFSILLKKLYMSRMTRTLGSLVASGVPVLQALSISSKAMSNVHLEAAILDVAEKVKSGIPMSKPISDNPLFLPLVGQMIAVGEETGTLGDSLERVSSYFEDEVDEAVKNISTLIEPATMVVLGGMVAFLIAAVLLPIYGLVSSIH